MNQNNIISPAQARLNFVNEDYSNLYKQVNEQITEASRTKANVKLHTAIGKELVERVVKDLNEIGFSAYCYNQLDSNIYTLDISW